MTEPHPTLKIKSSSGREHRLVVVDHPGTQKMNLDATVDGSNGEKRKSVYADLTFEQAHEIADFIKAHVPLPRKIHPDWASIPVGARFGHYRDPAKAVRYPYLKVDENTVNYHGEIRTAPEPSQDRLVAEPEYAEARAAWDAMEVGDTFRFGSDKVRSHIKLSATKYRHDRDYGEKGTPKYGSTKNNIAGYLRYGVIPNPKPTRREQVNALPDGTRFSCPGPYAPLGHYIKLQEDVVWARGARNQWSIKPDAEHYAERWNEPGEIKLDED